MTWIKFLWNFARKCMPENKVNEHVMHNFCLLSLIFRPKFKYNLILFYYINLAFLQSCRAFKIIFQNFIFKEGY